MPLPKKATKKVSFAEENVDSPGNVTPTNSAPELASHDSSMSLISK